MNKIELFGKEITIKTHYCKFFSNPAEEILNPYINLYVTMDNCNANCKFCIYRNNNKKWNSKKYKEVLNHISSKIEIRKIGITGGEPTLNWDKFVEITNISREVSPKLELSLNTNGYNFDKLFEEIYKKYDSINFSRHHYDDKLNNEIFGFETPTSKEISNFSKLQTYPFQLSLRCNLIKNYIDNKKEIFKYMNWANSVGIYYLGLVSLMPVNDFSINNLVQFNPDSLIDDQFCMTKKWERCGGGCECSNYIYLPNNNFERPIRVYHKNTYGPSKITETLIFDGENLKTGFDGDIIY